MLNHTWIPHFRLNAINGRLVCRYGQIFKDCIVGSFPSVWGLSDTLSLYLYLSIGVDIRLLLFFFHSLNIINWFFSSIFFFVAEGLIFVLRVVSFGFLLDKHAHSTVTNRRSETCISLAYHISIPNKFNSHSNTKQVYFYCHLECC